MIDIRVATIDDLKIIREIALRTWPDAFREILSLSQIDFMLQKMYSIESLIEQVTVKNHVFLISSSIIESKRTDTGYCSYEQNYSELNKTKIHKLYVLPEHQKTGSGLALINRVESFAINNNIESLILNVNRYNKAVDFYIRRGFTIVNEEVIPIGNGFVMDDFVMEKRLCAPFLQ